MLHDMSAAELDQKRRHDQEMQRQFGDESEQDFSNFSCISSDPLPLQREIPASAPYPLESLGPILGPAAQAIHDVIRAPVAMCAQSVLGAAALAVQPFANVSVDGRTYPLSLYLLTVGESGERKSAVDKVALLPHREREERSFAQYEKDFNEYEIEKKAWRESFNEASRGAKKSTEERANNLRKVGQKPKPPATPLTLIEEPTYEGMVKLFGDGALSLGLFSDEGGRLVGGHALETDNALKTAAGLSNVWDGQAISWVRSGDERVKLFGRRLSTHLMMQGAVAEQLLSNQILTEQGLMSRFLWAWPESTVGKRFYQPENIRERPEMKAYNAKFEMVLASRIALGPY